MAKEKPVKCRYCKKQTYKSTSYSIKQGQYYCNENCYNLSQEKKEAQTDKVGVGEKHKSKKQSKRLQLTDYIQKLYLEQNYSKDNINWTLISAQLKNIQQYNEKLQYSTILYILKYMVEILDLDLFAENCKGSVLTLVPFYFDEAMNFYYKMKSNKLSKESLETITLVSKSSVAETEESEVVDFDN